MGTTMSKFKEALVKAFEKNYPIIIEIYFGSMEFLTGECDMVKVNCEDDHVIVKTGECEINLGIFHNVEYDDDDECYIFKDGDLSIEVCF